MNQIKNIPWKHWTKRFYLDMQRHCLNFKRKLEVKEVVELYIEGKTPLEALKILEQKTQNAN